MSNAKLRADSVLKWAVAAYEYAKLRRSILSQLKKKNLLGPGYDMHEAESYEQSLSEMKRDILRLLALKNMAILSGSLSLMSLDRDDAELLSKYWSEPDELEEYSWDEIQERVGKSGKL